MTTPSIQRKPDWIRVKAPVSKGYRETAELMKGLKLNTVCQEAACPNIGECWEKEACNSDDFGGYMHASLYLL